MDKERGVEQIFFDLNLAMYELCDSYNRIGVLVGQLMAETIDANLEFIMGLINRLINDKKLSVINTEGFCYFGPVKAVLAAKGDLRWIELHVVK